MDDVLQKVIFQEMLIAHSNFLQRTMEIECVVTYQSWRQARSAKFQTPRGYFLVDVWFEDGKPEFQFRSHATPVVEVTSSIEAANMLATAIQMAIAWAIQEMMLMAKPQDELTTDH